MEFVSGRKMKEDWMIPPEGGKYKELKEVHL